MLISSLWSWSLGPKQCCPRRDTGVVNKPRHRHCLHNLHSRDKLGCRRHQVEKIPRHPRINFPHGAPSASSSSYWLLVISAQKSLQKKMGAQLGLGRHFRKPVKPIKPISAPD